MIERYNCIEISKIWSDENKYQTWLDIEIAVCEAWNKLKVIPSNDLKLIKSKIKLDIKKFLEIEKETKHDIVAFTRMLSLKLGNEKKWIHYGLTSTDIVDTAQNYLIKQSNKIILSKLESLSKILKEKALLYKKQLIMGRSHGMFGEPTSLGLKFLLWYAEINRQIKRFKFAMDDIERVKLSCSMGNFAHLEFEVESYVANKFNLKIDPITTQVTQRDRHIFLFSIFSNIASTMEKISIEIRHLQRSEIGEIQEGFSVGQKGSSSMPHKKNPISSENICGIARLIRSNATVTFENNLLWHERDISHSSNERIIIPDTYVLVGYSLNRLTNVITNLVINKENIMNNIKKANNVFFSQNIISYVIKNKKISREEIYDLIQKVSFESLMNNKNFKDAVIESKLGKILSLNEIDKIFDIEYFIRNIDNIYTRVFKLNEK